MKSLISKLIWCATFALCVSGYGQDTTSIQNIKDSLPQVHPSLFLSEEEADEILARSANDDIYNLALKDGILENAKNAYVALNSNTLRIARQESTHPHQNIIQDMQDLALGSVFSKNPDYARRVADVMLEYASFYESLIPRRGSAGRLTAQTLNEAMIMVQFAWIYDLIAPNLTTEEAKQIEDHLLRPGAELLMSVDRGRSNWQTWHNAALASLGLVLRDSQYLDRALNGPSGFIYQVDNSIDEDGMWYELSISYHDYTMHAITLLAVACDRAGIDLFSGNEKLKAFYAAPLYYAYSNMTQASFHDAHPMSSLSNGSTSWNYPYAWAQYNNPEFLWIWNTRNSLVNRANDEKRIPPLLAQYQIDSHADYDVMDTPEDFTIGTELLYDGALRNTLGSTLFADTGIAILRGPAGEVSPEMAIIWKPNGTQAGHQHPNNLAIDWQSPNYQWLSASGKWVGYSSAMHKEWVQQTLSDNTIVVDGASQKPGGEGVPTWRYDEEGDTSAGSLITFTNGPVFGYVHAETKNVYPGVLLDRRVVHTKEYTLDLFSAHSNREHTYDWALNISGELKSATTELTEVTDAFADRGIAYKYLWDTHEAIISNAATTYWSDPDTTETFAVTTLPKDKVTMYTSTTPWKNRDRSSLILSSTAKNAQFLNIWRASDDRDPIADITQPTNGPTAVIKLSTGPVDILELGSDKPIERSIYDKFSYRSQSLFARMTKEGIPTSITLIQGDRLQLNSIHLELDSEANWSIQSIGHDQYLLIFDNPNTCNLSIESETDFTLMSVAPEGQSVAIKQARTHTWRLEPFTNYVITGSEQKTFELPPLEKTFRPE